MSQLQPLITSLKLQGRVTFMQHDFFRPQPIHDADVFFVRQVFHNYTTDDCAFVPALELARRS